MSVRVQPCRAWADRFPLEARRRLERAVRHLCIISGGATKAARKLRGPVPSGSNRLSNTCAGNCPLSEKTALAVASALRTTIEDIASGAWVG